MTTEMTEAEWQAAEWRDPLRFKIVSLGDGTDPHLCTIIGCVFEVTEEREGSYDVVVVDNTDSNVPYPPEVGDRSFSLPKKYVEQGIAKRVGGHTYVEPEMPPFFRDPRGWAAVICFLLALIPLCGLISIWPDAPRGTLPTTYFLEMK